MSNRFLREYRCECGKLLLKGIFLYSSLEIKCKKCGHINEIGQIKNFGSDTSYLFLFDKNGLISSADDSACKILGYTEKELLGMHFSEIDRGISQEMAFKLVPPNSILSEDNYLQLDTKNKTKSGQLLNVSVRFKLYKPTNDDANVLVWVNLEDKINIAEINKDVLSEFIDNACDFYFDIDKNGMAKYISSSVKNLFGISPEMGLGCSFFDFLADNDKEQSKKRFEYFVANREPYRILDHAGLDAQGNITNTDLFFTTNFDIDGRFIGYRVLGWLKK